MMSMSATKGLKAVAYGLNMSTMPQPIEEPK